MLDNFISFNQTIHIPSLNNENFLTATWNAPCHVKTLITTRQGGISQAPYHSLNLGAHVGDNPDHVAKNRQIVQQRVNKPLIYLNQTHSNKVIHAIEGINQIIDADASIDNTGRVACAVMTADCLPVLFCDISGTIVAAAHAGWRGLANGILTRTVMAMNIPSHEILTYFAPAIGAESFEVGQDVYDAFYYSDPEMRSAFTAIDEQKYLADIYQLAKLDLQRVGVQYFSGGEHCTVIERDRFFSYRRDGQTGRMISAIWLDK